MRLRTSRGTWRKCVLALVALSIDCSGPQFDAPPDTPELFNEVLRKHKKLLRSESQGKSALMWLTTKRALRDCADFAYFVRRVSFAADMEARPSFLVTDLPPTDVSHLGVARVILSTGIRGFVEDKLILAVLSGTQELKVVRFYAVSVLEAKTRPELVIDTLMRYVFPSEAVSSLLPVPRDG